MSQSSDLRWYHCILSTYGSWLPGDPRGFRTRHHREHVEEDYKSPPPRGLYDERLKRSKQLQSFPGASMDRTDRETIGKATILFLKSIGVEVIAIAISGRHLHLQMQCPPIAVTPTLGRLKRHLWYTWRDSGHSSRLWGGGRKVIPIVTRDHQVATFQYILRHRDEGAWCWSFRDEVPL